MALRRRVLSDSQILQLDGLEGAEKRWMWEDLKEIRKEQGYGDGYVATVSPLLLPSEAELDEGMARGHVPYRERSGSVVKIPVEGFGGTLVAGFDARQGSIFNYHCIRYNAPSRSLRFRAGLYGHEISMGFASASADDMGHMYLDPTMRKTGILMPALRIARDHAVAGHGYARFDYVPEAVMDRFVDLFERLGYEKLPLEKSQSLGRWEYSKPGDQRNDLDKYYRFFGTSPQTARRASLYRQRT